MNYRTKRYIPPMGYKVMQKEKEEAERKTREAERRRAEDAQRAAQAEDARRAAEIEEAQAASGQVSGEAPDSDTASVDVRTELPPPAPEKAAARRASAAKPNASPRRRSSTRKVVMPNSRTKKAGRREPPVEKRFKPGQSGNPSGRPKGSRNKVTRGSLARALIDEATRIAPGQSELSVHRQVVRALVDKATAGSVPALQLYMTLTAEAEAKVADLDDAAAAQEQEALERQERLAARKTEEERRRVEAAEDDDLARRLAAEDLDLYRAAKALLGRADRSVGPGGQPPKLRFVDAVHRVRVNRALGVPLWENIDPYVAEAILNGSTDAEVKEQAEEDVEEGDPDMEEGGTDA